MERTNAACSWIGEPAGQSRAFTRLRLHKLTYSAVRERFGLSAPMTVGAIAKVTDRYQRDRSVRRKFRPTGATR